jgi:hypothetical protein
MDLIYFPSKWTQETVSEASPLPPPPSPLPPPSLSGLHGSLSEGWARVAAACPQTT